jgi:hypothetical protein
MPEVEPLSDSQLRAAAAAVLADFPEGASIDLTLTWWQEADARWWRSIEGGDARVYGPCEPQDEPELLVDIAHFLQDNVFDTEPWGEARPICPGHPHPPDPQMIDGTAVWTCPRDGTVLAPIGQLSGE